MATTLITGAAGALGSALARALSARGDALVLVDTTRGRERLEALASGLPKATAIAGELAEEATWRAAIAAADRHREPLSYAAFVAGAWQGGTPLYETKDDAAWEAMLSSNLDTVYRGLKALLPGMVQRRAGSIVVVGSRNVERPWAGAGAAAYTASKSGAVALAEAAAAEVREHGVRINAVLPSTMDTPANRAAMPDADFSLWVTTESCAGVIAFLLSDAARDVSGAAIPVYGRA
jgi:NAD(P)-dependent dehydrogenase (short-subunit alcohol dehydrogenase family)